MRSASLLPFAALAAATPFKSVQDYARALKIEARVDITEQSVADFNFYAEHAGASYCNFNTPDGSAVTCGGGCPGVESNGVTILKTFQGFWSGIGAYVAIDNTRDEIVFSVRGSNNVRNWIANILFDREDCDLVAGCGLHYGFLGAWREMSPGVQAAIASARAAHPTYRVVATGHSLGGAVATIGAAYLRRAGIPVDIYSFGAPRVGNVAVSNFISNQAGAEYRITHKDDPVPRLPPIFTGYAHVTPEIWLSGSEAKEDTYPLGEIRVCDGAQSIRCNGGTLGLNVDAHMWYFGDISMCSPKFSMALSADEPSDEELEAQVNEWVKKDIDYVDGA